MTETLTTETPVATTRQAVNRPGGGTGRRKQAVARVRVTPGSGQWKINGRDLEVYFPNKVHQQIVTEPFRVLVVPARCEAGQGIGRDQGRR